jgi:hypothetical protein
MIWALLIFLAVVAAVHWWEYKSDVQEYTFAQPARLDKRDELRSVLAEKTLLTVEIGVLPWRPTVAENAGWLTSVETDAGVVQMPVSEWRASGGKLADGAGLATEMELVTGLADLDAARGWWWLPGIRDASVGVLKKGEVLGLQWVSAERQWIGCSHGGPMTVWVAHSRYRRYLPAGEDVNPWTLTVAEAPWIGRVQYIEVVVRPGWALGLPAHWGFAVQSEEEAWWWTASQHSAMSWALTAPRSEELELELEGFALEEETAETE